MSDARQDDGTPVAETPPAPPATPPVAAPAAPPTNFRATAWVAALLVLALALVGTSPYWAPPLLPLLPWGPPQEAGTATLAARLDAAEAARADITARLAKLEAQIQQQGAQSAAPADAAELQQISQRLDALEQRVGTIAAPDTTALTQSLQQMSARLDDLDAKLGRVAAADAAGDQGDMRLLAALAGLRAALAGSGPFEGELDGTLALAHDDAAAGAALQPLTQAATTGIPSAALLAERFRAETAPAILQAAAVAAVPAESDLGDRVLAQLKRLVTIRRIDAGGSDDATQGAVRAAEGALQNGDLAGALKALQGLNGAAADAAKPFVATAQQRLDAEKTVAGLAQKVAARLGASTAPQPPQESH